MEGTPYTSDTLVDTFDRLGNLLQLLSVRVPQQLCLLQNLLLLKIPYADGLVSSIDVVPDDYRVLARSW